MKYFGIVLFLVAAIIVYMSKKIASKIYKVEEVDDKQNVTVKMIGLVISLVSLAIIFLLK